MNVQVVGLHRLPFDEERFAADYAQVAGRDHDAALRRQWLDNWNNAWLIVVEATVAANALDFSGFWYGTQRDENAQAAWAEQLVSVEGPRVLAAFYLHFVKPGTTIGFQGQRLTLPDPTPPPAWLWEKAPYTSPD